MATNDESSGTPKRNTQQPEAIVLAGGDVRSLTVARNAGGIVLGINDEIDDQPLIHAVLGRDEAEQLLAVLALSLFESPAQ